MLFRSRYYQGKALYPFGYGLTYGDTRALSVAVDGNEAKVLVRNDGRETEDVLQLYVKDMASPDAPVNPVLWAFQRVHLAEGEEKEITLKLPTRAFQVCNEQGAWVPGSGKWTVFASFGQPDERTQELTGKKAASCVVE